jgi:sarcosine/dimethylglycine N-methyltransferase
MNDINSKVCKHWKYKGNQEEIINDLKRRGLSLNDATKQDLSTLDQMHSGQLEATRIFAKWAHTEVGNRVLDIGSGLGGSARFLASEYDCFVLATDLSPDLTDTGRELTKHQGLDDQVRHQCAHFLDIEEEEPFDVVWIQHVDMQIPDKMALYNKARTSLCPNGKIVWHDWMHGAKGTPHYPTMWSKDGSLSFPLASEAELENLLNEAGMKLQRFETLDQRTAAWFDTSKSRLTKIISKLGPDDPRVEKSLNPLLKVIINIARNLQESRLLPFMAEATVKKQHRVKGNRTLVLSGI